MAIDKTGLVCGNNSCLGGAGQIITKGMAGQGCNLVVGFFYHQIRIEEPKVPAKRRTPITPRMHFEEEHEDRYEDHDNVDVFISVRWPWMENPKRMNFTMKRSWANMVVNRINQINSFNEQFTVSIGDIKNNFSVKYDQLKEKFKTKWKK